MNMMNVVHEHAVSTTAFDADSDPPPAELLRSIRADLDALHAIARALVPLASSQRKDEAIALGSSVIDHFADATYYAAKLESLLLTEEA